MKINLIMMSCFFLSYCNAMEIDEPDDDTHSIERRMHNAAKRGDYDLLRKFITKEKASVDAMYNGYTPLQIACARGNRNAAALLLFYGADFSITGPNGCTAFSIAESKIAESKKQDKRRYQDTLDLLNQWVKEAMLKKMQVQQAKKVLEIVDKQEQ